VPICFLIMNPRGPIVRGPGHYLSRLCVSPINRNDTVPLFHSRFSRCRTNQGRGRDVQSASALHQEQSNSSRVVLCQLYEFFGREEARVPAARPFFKCSTTVYLAALLLLLLLVMVMVVVVVVVVAAAAFKMRAIWLDRWIQT